MLKSTMKKKSGLRSTARREAGRTSAARKPRTAPGRQGRAKAAARASSGLTKKDLAEFRALLLSKRAQLMGDVDNLHAEALRQSRQDASGDLSSMPIHMADIGTDNYEQEFTLGLLESERAILHEIDEALERIDKGTYGLCVATGKPIGKKRLRANPWAKYCYEYKLAQERGLARGP